MDTTPTPLPLSLMPLLDQQWLNEPAANDPGFAGKDSGERIPDINILVSNVVQKVSSRLKQNGVSVELDLCSSVPELSADPRLISFVLAGIVVAELHSVEDSERGIIRVKTETFPDAVKVSILGNSLPLLRFIRAVADEDGDQGQGEMDPTMIHCRRILEEQGGWIELRDDDGFVGFDVNVPALPLCNPVGLLNAPFKLHKQEPESDVSLAS